MFLLLLWNLEKQQFLLKHQSFWCKIFLTCFLLVSMLTYLFPMHPFSTPWKHQTVFWWFKKNVNRAPIQTNRDHAIELSAVGHIISGWHWKDPFDLIENVNTTDSSKDQYGKLWDLFPTFLWSCTYNFENFFTAWSQTV